MAGKDDTGALPEIRVPATLTFLGLMAGLALGIFLQGSPGMAPLLTIAGPVGDLWLQALKMTILPLVAGLLFTGIVEMAAAARAGAMATRTLGLFVVILAGGAMMSALIMPFLLELAPVPVEAAAALGGLNGDPGPVPGIADFLSSIIPENIVSAASENAMLPVIIFISLFALASTRLAEAPRSLLTSVFKALAGAMMVMIGWVLALAPLGVFALGFGLAAKSGAAAVGALTHYILLVAAIGAVVLLCAYFVAVAAARQHHTQRWLPLNNVIDHGHVSLSMLMRCHRAANVCSTQPLPCLTLDTDGRTCPPPPSNKTGRARVCPRPCAV